MIKFEAPITNIGDRLLVRLPGEASQQLPSRGQVMVVGKLNEREVTLPLEPDGYGGHWFTVDDELQKATSVALGDTVELAIEPTKDWPEPEIPPDLQKALNGDATAYATWQKATPAAHWEWLRWLNSTTNPATRAKRVGVSLSKLGRGERRPCCFNRNMCCVGEVSVSGKLIS